MNLVLVSQLLYKGAKVYFSEDKAEICSLKITFTAIYYTGLYVLNFWKQNMFSPQAFTFYAITKPWLQIWHK